MSPQALIRQAQESGVALRLVGGKVKACGPRQSVTLWLDRLRQHRAALVNALRAEPAGPAHVQAEAAVPELASWSVLDAAYQAHHFSCPTCIAAGRGSRYGLRCGAGMALWRAYSEGAP